MFNEGIGTLKKTKNHNTRNIILAVLSVLLLLGLVFFGSQNFSQKAPNSSNQAKTLNMAVVNEDNGTTYRNKKYDLAKEYLNGLHLPKNVSMDVVPRGVAESGLKRNTYQLVIFIPIDFSKKIVEVDNPNPKKLHIKYKINAKTQSMKLRCRDEADEIIQGLNKKLVSIYDLGIMSNLFDAQNKVAGIYARQDALATDYSNGLAEPISDLSQGFPDLQSGTKSILSEGKAYQQAQKQINQAQLLADSTQSKDMANELTKIMQKQSQNNQNKAELVQQAMRTSVKTDNQIPQEMNALANQNEQLSSSIGDSKSTAGNQLQEEFENYSKNYENKIDELQKILQNTDEQLNPNEVKDAIDSTNKNNESSLNGNTSNSVTLGDYLKKNDSELYNQLINFNKIDDLNKLYEQLPFNNELPDNVKKVLSDKDYNQIKKDINLINECNIKLNELGLNPKFDGNNRVVSEFNDDYDEFENSQNNNHEFNKTQTQEIVLDGFKNVENDEFEITVPNNVEIKNAQKINGNTYKVSIDNSKKLTLDLIFNPIDLKGEDPTVKIIYNHKADAPQEVTITNPTTQESISSSQKQSDQISSQQSNQTNNSISSTNTVSSETSKNFSNNETQTQKVSNDKDRQITISFNLAGISEEEIPTNAKIEKEIGKWIAQYNDAAQMASERVRLLENKPIQKLMDENLSDALSDLVNKTNNQAKQQNNNLLAVLKQNSDQLAQQKDTYMKDLSLIGSNSKKALEDAQQQIQQLQQMQDQMNKNAQESSVDSKGLDNVDLSTLSDQASDTNKNVSQDSDAFNGIYDELTNLNNSLGSIQNSGKSLNGKSVNLQKAFRNELAKSGDFTQSFINVLNAAYKNGVPNQKLLNFITNPVGSSENELITERTQSYNMGMWTIVLIIMAWFISYVVETMKYFQNGKYFSRKQTKLNIHVRKLIFLSILSILDGIILAPIAAKQFPIINANRILWYLSFIFLSISMTFIVYILMHNIKIGGTALVVAALLNYIFNQTQFVKNIILEHLNVLDLVGNQLLNVAMFNTTNSVLGLVIMGVLIIAGGLMILFIPDLKREVSNEEAMV